MEAVENFLIVVVMPILVATLAIGGFRWWLRRSTGLDPADDERKTPTVRETDSYAPYLAPKWKEEQKNESKVESKK
jgi:hypothetical protein